MFVCFLLVFLFLCNVLFYCFLGRNDDVNVIGLLRFLLVLPWIGSVSVLSFTGILMLVSICSGFRTSFGVILLGEFSFFLVDLGY